MAKKGLTYERKVARLLKRLNAEGELPGELYLSQWIAYEDKNGQGFAQVDAFLVRDDLILLVEVKLTQTDYAKGQMLKLYLPLLKKIYQRPVVCLQVCKNLRRVPENKSTALELVKNPKPGVWTWHWLG